jgi:hypothetical protein
MDYVVRCARYATCLCSRREHTAQQWIYATDPRAEKHFGKPQGAFNLEIERMLPRRGRLFKQFREWLDANLDPEDREAIRRHGKRFDQRHRPFFSMLSGPEFDPDPEPQPTEAPKLVRGGSSLFPFWWLFCAFGSVVRECLPLDHWRTTVFPFFSMIEHCPLLLLILTTGRG